MEESSKINDMIFQVMGIKRKHVLPIIIEGQSKGIFTTEVSADHLMHIIIGSFRLQMFKWRTSNFLFNLEENGNKLIESLLSLITTKK